MNILRSTYNTHIYTHMQAFYYIKQVRQQHTISAIRGEQLKMCNNYVQRLRGGAVA